MNCLERFYVILEDTIQFPSVSCPTFSVTSSKNESRLSYYCFLPSPPSSSFFFSLFLVQFLLWIVLVFLKPAFNKIQLISVEEGSCIKRWRPDVDRGLFLYQMLVSYCCCYSYHKNKRWRFMRVIFLFSRSHGPNTQYNKFNGSPSASVASERERERERERGWAKKLSHEMSRGGAPWQSMAVGYWIS